MFRWLCRRKPYTIEVVTGKSGKWYSRIMNLNTQTQWHSESYSSKQAAVDSAANAAKAFGIRLFISE